MSRNDELQKSKWSWPLALVGVMSVLAAAGCASPSEVSEPPVADIDVSLNPADGTRELGASSENDPTETNPVEPGIDPTSATEAWIAMWGGVELVVTDPALARTTITAVAVDAVFDQLDTIYSPDVASGIGNSPRVFGNNPVASEQADGSVQIEDCMFETPKIGNATIWYSGIVRTTGDGRWRVESVRLTSEIGCVPADLAQEAIDGYEAYWDARVEFWDPADVLHPLVRRTLTGEQLVLIESLLADHAERGLAFRGRAADHPEVIEVRSPTEVAILDCMTQDPARGLYVVETGERLGDIPPIAEGQLDLTSAVMILEDGVWKVSDVQGQADVSCDMAPTPQGLPVV